LPRSEPMLLSLNTCGSTASAALGVADAEYENVRIVAAAELAVRTYSARLIPEIDAMLRGQQATMRDITHIVVVNGPGSFTGIRVGVSTAKGLAESANIPIVAVSRLALLAAASGLPHVLAAVDAGRGEYYVGEYRNGNQLAEVLLTVEETVAFARQPGAGVLVCDESRAGDIPAVNTNANTSACAVLATCGPIYVQPPDAAEALRFALGRIRAQAFDDAETLTANYLRRSDAEVFLSAKTK
jgi:tRNA threonylcarbamoyladenosine biosynthesis protein TsaB